MSQHNRKKASKEVICVLDGSHIKLASSTTLPAQAMNTSIGRYGIYGGSLGDFSRQQKKHRSELKSKDHGKIIQEERHYERKKWSHR